MGFLRLTADLTAVRVKEAILLESKTIRKRRTLVLYSRFPFLGIAIHTVKQGDTLKRTLAAVHSSFSLYLLAC